METLRTSGSRAIETSPCLSGSIPVSPCLSVGARSPATAQSLRPTTFFAITALLAGLFWLGACRATAAPPPTTQPPPTPASRGIQTSELAAGSATPNATLLPTETPGGWLSHEGELFTIRIPPGWQGIQPTDENAEATFAAFKQANPDLAAILGGAEPLRTPRSRAIETPSTARGLGTTTFQASNPESGDSSFADNLNIRRVELGDEAMGNLAEVAELIVAQYRQLSFDVQEVKSGMEVGQRPAVRIVYAFLVTDASGSTIPVEGMQYLVVMPADLWIVTYTAARDRFAGLEPVFEQSAQSFRVK